MEWNQEQEERRSETKRGTGAGSVEHKYKVLPLQALHADAAPNYWVPTGPGGSWICL